MKEYTVDCDSQSKNCLVKNNKGLGHECSCCYMCELFCKYESVKMGYWTAVFLCNMIDSVPLL